MNLQPQPPERRLLHDPQDFPSVLRDAEIPYGYNRDAALAAFLEGLSSSGIPHVLVGALAMLQYVDGRTTRDIDFIIATGDLKRLPDFVLEEGNEWFATGTSGPLRVDLLFTANPFFALILERYSEQRIFLDSKIQCATPDGIVLLKLFALPSLYRQGNVDRAALYETDILQLLHHHPVAHNGLLATLAPYMSDSDIRALRAVLQDIDQRIQRISRHSEY